MNYKLPAFLIMIVFLPAILPAQIKKSGGTGRDEIARLTTNPEAKGTLFEITFLPGRGHNHPSFAIWLETTDGRYVETLYVTGYVATGIFRYGSMVSGKWEPAPVQRRAALPYWGHKRCILNELGNYLPSVKAPLPDAISGPTPKGAFVLSARANEMLKGNFRVLIEINQTWDWNPFWHNSKYPDDSEYRTSAQPAVVYAADLKSGDYEMLSEFRPLGRSHHSGADGGLYDDLNTLTTALEIAGRITVQIKEN